jgi:hypothetical protein
MTSPSDARRGRAGLRALPWIVTVAAIGWIFATTDLQGMIDAVRQADWVLFLGAMAGLYLLVWVADSYAVLWVLRRFHVPTLRLRDVMPPRGATYLLGIINYAAGTAAMTVYFRRRYGIGVIQGGASLLLMMLGDLGILVLVTAVGAGTLPPEVRPGVWLILACFVAGAIGHLVFWRAPWTWGPLERVRALPQFRGFRDATIRDYAAIVATRIPIVALYIAIHAVTLHAFGIRIPFERLLVYVPAQMFVAALPISVAGLGTGQAAQRLLYAPYVGSDRASVVAGLDPAVAIIDAYGLALFLGFVLPRVIIGLLCTRAVADAMARGTDPDPSPSSTP